MNNNNRVVEVHESSHGGTLFSSIGTLNSGNSISRDHSPEDYTSGGTPSVALTRIMNCLYVDYVEYARVTDVCIQQNE